MTAVGTASAQRGPEREARVDTAPNLFQFSYGDRYRANPQQHGGDAGHLPPTQKNMQIVSKLEPGGAGNIAPEQIADLAVFKGFAYLNSWSQPSCDKGGTYVVDIRDPAAPKDVTFIPALPFNYHGEGAHAATIDTPAFRGDVLAVNNETTCAPDDANIERGGGFDLYDVSDPTKPVALTQGFGDFGEDDGTLTGDKTKANDAHSIYIWDAGEKAYAVIVDNEELYDTDIFDITDPRNPVPVREYALAYETPAWTETPNQDQANLHDMVVKQINGTWVLLASNWDAGYIQMNVNDPANAEYMSDSDFGTSDPLTGFDPPEGNAHQAEYTNDNRFILTGEEDFDPYRVTEIDIDGVGPRDAANVGGGAPPEVLPDGVLNGPVAYGGYGCDASDPIPTPEEAGMPAKSNPDEEYIIALQRGPAYDSDEDYDDDGDTANDEQDACFPGDKAANADEKGWDAVLLVNRHPANGQASADEAYCGSGAYPPGAEIVTVCTTHAAFHEMFDDPPTFAVPYDDSDGGTPDEGPGIGDVSPHEIFAEGFFDGWGYMSMYGTTPDENGKLPLVDTFAIEESLNPDYAVGFGDLSIHEQATDPTAPLSYAAYYSGGMRVFSYEGGQITEQGAFIDQGGSNFWGVEQFTAANGERLIAGSDRDYGLYIFRYTGPFAVGPTPPTPPGPDNSPKPGRCTNLVAVVAGQRLAGTAAGEQITGTESADVVNAGAGDDCVDGLGGNDDLRGGPGVDAIDGQRGNDRLRGDSGRGNLRGGTGSDRLTGGSARDVLTGNTGRDRLSGGRGNDQLFGSSGADRITGGRGKDVIEGGTGSDRIYARDGRADRIDCGFGRDRVVSRDRGDKLTSCERKARIRRAGRSN